LLFSTVTYKKYFPGLIEVLEGQSAKQAERLCEGGASSGQAGSGETVNLQQMEELRRILEQMMVEQNAQSQAGQRTALNRQPVNVYHCLSSLDGSQFVFALLSLCPVELKCLVLSLNQPRGPM